LENGKIQKQLLFLDEQRKPNNYLPNYYIAFINITQAFQRRKKSWNNLLTKAQNLIDL
jgi:hypothetical protein